MKRLLFLLSIILLFSTPVQSRTITGFDTNQDFRLVQVEAGIYSPGISLYPKEKVLGASISLPVQGGTGIGSATTFDIGSVLTVSSSNPFQYKFVATSSLGISVSETDPIFGAWLLNPILTSLTTTNFFATNTLFLNATTTNLGVNNIFSFGVPTFVIKTDAGDNTGNMEIRLGVNENGELNLFGGLYLNNGLSSPNPSGRASLVTLPLTASREITFQDKDGVFAYTNDNISEFTNDIGYITNAEETDPIWTAFLADPIFTNLTSTNFFATNTQFVNATTTNLYVSSKAMIGTTTNTYSLNVGGYVGGDRYYTSNPNSYIQADGTTGITIAGGNTTINTGYLYAATAGTSFYSQGGAVFRGGLSNDTGSALTINGGTGGITNLVSKVGINSSSPVGTLGITGVSGVNPVRVNSSTGSQLFAINSNGQVVVGANSLAQTGQLSVETPTTNDYALTFTNGVHYTAALGRQPGTSGQMFVGGLSGTSLNLWAGGSSRMIILNNNGYVGINSSSPSTQFVVVGTSTFDGAFFQTGLGDCELDTQTVNYDLTTGKFSCLTDDTGSGSGVNNVGTSTANYFTFYTSSTAVTGTPWVTFANGALTVTTNTSFTIISSTNALFTNATTTNLYTTNLNINGTVLDTSALLSYAEKNYLTCDTGYFEGGLVYTDDVCQVRSTDLVWNYSETPKRLYVNGSIDSTGDLTSTNAVFLGDTTAVNGYYSGNLIIDGDLTIGGALTLGSLVIASTTINSAGISTNNVILNYTRPVDGSSLSKPLLDEGNYLVGTPLASTNAFYTDDDSRILLCVSTAGTGAVSLKNSSLAPNNTGQSAFYDSAGNLQTITAATLFGAGYAIKGCITVNGYHWVLGTSSTAATLLKVATSSYSVNLASAASWRTASWTSDTPSSTVISIAGVAVQGGVDKIMIVSSSTKLVPATFNGLTGTITPDNPSVCTPSGSMTLNNTRANATGYFIGQSSAPFVRKYNVSCGEDTYNGFWGQAAPASTGPDLFATECSIYSLNGSALFRQKGYSGC